MEKNETRVVRICHIWYVLKEDVVSVNISVDDTVDITLGSGVDWEQIPFTPGTGTISEKVVRRAAGRCYEQEMVADIPGEDEPMVPWSLLNDLRPCVLKIVQNNGTKIYGDTEYPVRLTTEWSMERSSTTLRFNRVAKERARFLNEEFSGSGA